MQIDNVHGKAASPPWGQTRLPRRPLPTLGAARLQLGAPVRRGVSLLGAARATQGSGAPFGDWLPGDDHDHILLIPSVCHLLLSVSFTLHAPTIPFTTTRALLLNHALT